MSGAAVLNRTLTKAAARYKWWVVFMLWLICFFNYADRQAIYSVFPKLSEEFGFNKVQLGLIGSAFMWVYAAGAPIAGLAGDRFRRKHLILGGCMFWSLVTMLTGRCSKLAHFVAVRGVEGMGETFYFPSATSLMSDYHDRRTRSRALAIHNSSVYIGTIAGGWVGALLAVHFGWRVAFYFFGSAGIVVAFVLCRWLKEPVRGQADLPVVDQRAAVPGSGAPLAWKEIATAIFRQPGALLLLFAFMGANFVAAIFLTWTPTFLVEKFGFKLAAAGLSGSIFIHLASAIGAPAGGWIADRWSLRYAGGRALVQALGLVLGSVFVFLVGATSSVGVLLLTMTLFGFCKGLYDSNIFAALFDYVEPRARGTAAGVMNTVGWGGGAIAPVVVGWVTIHGRGATEMDNMSTAISSCALIYLAAAGLLFTASRFFAPLANRAPLDQSNPA
jgi:MFS family permease